MTNCTEITLYQISFQFSEDLLDVKHLGFFPDFDTGGELFLHV